MICGEFFAQPRDREHSEGFELYNLETSELFEEKWLQNRTDIRLTLDEADDSPLLKRIYDENEYTDSIPIRDVIDHIEAKGLAEINEAVRQKKT